MEATCCESMNYKAGNLKAIKCSKTRLQECWNYSVCQKRLQVQCSFEGVVACSEASRWTCSTGRHQYNIHWCKTGAPRDCPECSSERLEAAIRNPLIIPAPSLSKYLDFMPSESIEALQTDSSHSVRLEIKLLRQHKDSGKNAAVNSFDPKTFLNAKSMYGIITERLTKANLLKLAEEAEGKPVTMLVGSALVARTKVMLDKGLPSNKKKRIALVQDVLDDEFNSMLYIEKGLENLIVWDPFPLVAVFRLELSKDQLIELGGRVCDLPMPNLEPLRILYDPPPEGTVVVRSETSATDNLGDDSDTDSVADDRDHQATLALLGTPLEGLHIDLDWPGGISSDGALSHDLESDLLDKMQFVNLEAPAFAGFQRLKKLLSKTPTCSLLHLLMAAEISHRSPERAQEHLKHYLNGLQHSGAAERLHPWSLVVAARAAPEQAERLLTLFVTLYPMQKKLLTPSEIERLRSDQSGKPDATVEWPEVLRVQWAKLQAEYPSETRSDAMGELLRLTGLRKVKEEALRLWNSSLQLRRMDPEARKKNLLTANYTFLGNPGSGKTSVARLFASILCDSGVREKNVFVETTAQAAKDGGTDEFRKLVTKSIGGVLFIDEAYDLDPVGDFKGKPIVNELLTLSENKRDEISFILAGYEDDFDKKFFACNPGLKSRFRTVLFEDFDEQELKTIWTSMRKDKGWEEADDVCNVITKRLMKMAGRKGFGNAREVRKRLEDATQAAMSSLGHDFSMDTMKLEIEDVIGQDPRLMNEKLKRVQEEIDRKIGWGRVKKHIGELLVLCGVNYEREMRGQPPLDIFLNRMFLGNPGTGKTTCAKLYGRLLKELGFLSNGDVVSKTASDFVGSVTGESQTRTSQIIESSRGKVLIIDEAYALDDSFYGKQVLDTLTEKVQGSPSEDIAVLLLGYEEQMLAMIRNQNPGLTRRFPKDHAFYFDDYSDNELLEIINLNLKTSDVKASLEFCEKALDALRAQRSQANFGNASAAELVVKDAILKATERLGSSFDVLTLEDIDIDDPGTGRSEKDADPLAQLDGLYRMDKVKEQLEKMRKTWSVSKQDGDDEPKLGHFVFTGSPGTGKTTVARTIASVLFSLGLLPSDKIVETSALELTADFVGQTSTKVTEALKEALGGILFIDEAYNLGIGPFGREACDTIVAAMTSEQFRSVVIVIAGYPHEIDVMLNSNAGLKSRFTHFFEFPDWQPDDCKSFFELLARKKKFILGDAVLEAVEKGCIELLHMDGWANGRDVTKLWEQAKSNRDARVYETEETDRILLVQDVSEAITSMLNARRSKPCKRNNDPQGFIRGDTPPAFATDSRDREAPPQRTNTKQHQQSRNVEDEPESSPITDEEEDVCDQRDDGVSDEIWNELQIAKQRERERLTMLQREQEAYEEWLLQQAELEREAQRRYEMELERIRQEKLERELQELALQKAEEAERKRKHEVELERKRREDERQRREEEIRQKMETEKRLQQIRPCPVGFSWLRVGHGWRCRGGAHFVSDEELKSRFGCDV